MSYQLSYIVATCNRLNFLTITLQRLIPELQAGEEIVVVDGNSTDGSKEYLERLFREGQIHQFISEPDQSQAHAWNKAMLMAKGTIIKKIIDDDVFCYKAIRECKNYMLAHPKVDIIISNDLGSSLHDYKNIHAYSRIRQFGKWNQKLIPSFTFGDVHMLIRKSALSYIGLYNTAYIMLDWEYSLRISYLQTHIAYYTGYNALSVAHPLTVSSQKNVSLVEEQGKRACVFYEYAGDRAEISAWSKIKIFIGKKLYNASQKKHPTDNTAVTDIAGVYDYYYDYLAACNAAKDFIFIEKQ